jgi:hypothetical protein
VKLPWQIKETTLTRIRPEWFRQRSRVQYDEPVITQVDEWDEDVHFPTFGTPAISYRFEADEGQDLAESTFNRFARTF